jgi:hypothetical protein
MKGGHDARRDDGAGMSPRVRVFDGRDGSFLFELMAYDPGFTAGVYVAAGDINRDGRTDIITGPESGLPRVRVFSGADGALLWQFNAYAVTSKGGVRAAAADVTGDGRADIVTARGAGRTPLVKVFHAATRQLLRKFQAYSTRHLGGVFVAAGDVTGDGRADIITGQGRGTPLVRVWNGRTGALRSSFRAFGDRNTGVRLAAADVNGDGRADILAAPGPVSTPLLRIFNGWTLAQIDRFFAFEATMTGGLFVAGQRQ